MFAINIDSVDDIDSVDIDSVDIDSVALERKTQPIAVPQNPCPSRTRWGFCI